jgi:hypothetical protein
MKKVDQVDLSAQSVNVLTADSTHTHTYRTAINM